MNKVSHYSSLSRYDGDIKRALKMPKSKALQVEIPKGNSLWNVYVGLRARVKRMGYADKLKVRMLKGIIIIIHKTKEVETS